MYLKVYFCTEAFSRQLPGICIAIHFLTSLWIWSHPSSLIITIWSFTIFTKVYLLPYRNYRIFVVGLLFFWLWRDLSVMIIFTDLYWNTVIASLYIWREIELNFAWFAFELVSLACSEVSYGNTCLNYVFPFAAMTATSTKSLGSWDGKFCCRYMP